MSVLDVEDRRVLVEYVSARKALGLSKHWAMRGWSKGPKRRRCDIMLDRNALVAIEYHLAARGLLRPRDS